jgi:subtilisin family serine protease
MAFGESPVVIAVVDTGVDYDNPLIQKYLWTNPGEIPGNGLDDDHNGFIDDVHGWDFVRQSPIPTDNHGHGTHVTGIIIQEILKQQAAGHENFVIMPLKYYDSKFSFSNTLANTVRALEYAVKMGAHVINYSGGGNQYSSTERLAIEKAMDKGILVVAAAGNEGENMDRQKFYPAGYNLPNIIAVTAVDSDGEVLPTSNYGAESVELAAEGKNIRSWIQGNKISLMTGTSQATAFVTGAAALLMQQFPFMKNNALETIKSLKAGAVMGPKLTEKTKSGYLNVKRSLANYPAGVDAFGISDSEGNELHNPHRNEQTWIH